MARCWSGKIIGLSVLFTLLMQQRQYIFPVNGYAALIKRPSINVVTLTCTPPYKVPFCLPLALCDYLNLPIV